MTGASSNLFHGHSATLERRKLLVGLLATMASITACGRVVDKPVPRILFVCQFGTVKSAIAREILRQRAAERGIAIIAYSRGITPEDHISPMLRAQLEADGIEYTRDSLQKLVSSDLDAADIVVTFNPLPPDIGPVDILDWSTLPSMNNDYATSRTDLTGRIDGLLDQIMDKARLQEK